MIVCSVKPMQREDVSEYADLVHRYLGSKKGKDGGHGCHTQVRLEPLRVDGLHIQPRFYHVLQQTYVFALMRKYCPDPTPPECFIPDHVKLAYMREWPLFGRDERASKVHHGRNR